MRLMGLDVGSKTVGVAISDELGWTAQGVEIIAIDEANENFGMKRLKKLVEEYRVTGFVLGLPKNMNNTSGPRVARSRAYGDRVAHKFGLPVDYEDERLTTVQAERVLIAGDVSRKKRKQVIDKLASVVILQNYLDAHGPLTQQK
ncbi:Holliday junction resolvase RuvX [Lapidilactobacillus wuchangensis]|uniref:Holliday junction resolvase RuvX n=1 Tax=Lapidilactobacillus wuchangensis TaxID=2486001 RepID=UPI000F7850E0|nr:Holliday junction resolvase RuvX [Lapidilactobacillus wuchangensis]